MRSPSHLFPLLWTHDVLVSARVLGERSAPLSTARSFGFGLGLVGKNTGSGLESGSSPSSSPTKACTGLTTNYSLGVSITMCRAGPETSYLWSDYFGRCTIPLLLTVLCHIRGIFNSKSVFQTSFPIFTSQVSKSLNSSQAFHSGPQPLGRTLMYLGS